MKNIFIKLAALVFLVSLFSVGSVQAAAPPGGPGNLQPLANRGGAVLGKTRDQGWLEDQEQEEKNERFKVLEWVIKQRLLKQYEKMEIADYLEDGSD